MICKKEGFTLVEVLIALSLLSFGLMAVASLAGTVIRGAESGRRQTQAVNLASEKLEILLKSVPYGDVQSSNADPNASGRIIRNCSGAAPTFTCTPVPSTEAFGSLTYNWRWTVTFVDLDGDGVLVEGTGIADARDIKSIDVEVTWTDLFGSHSTRLTSLRKV